MWHEVAGKGGVTLREYGEGRAVYIFPGMEGSGESCLQLVVPVIERIHGDGTALRPVLVDYAQENHRTIDDLIGTIHDLICATSASEACIFWGQSFGNLLAAGVARRGGIEIRKVIMVSAFTRLPPLRARAGATVMALTPAPVYRATIKPLGRYLFGPVGDQPDHPFFDALRRGDPAAAARRTGWLRRREFSSLFIDISAPTKVWLGQEDRLVDLSEQRAFFKALATGHTGYELAMIRGSGHVVLPTTAVQRLRSDMLTWIAHH
jgi:pimeloyl-ACP methyl ester carboxylesterase